MNQRQTIKVKGESYHVTGDIPGASVTFWGTLRLQNMSAYTPIMQLMDEVSAAAIGVITLNLEDLRFLNSSGINMLFRFVIQTCDQGDLQVVVRGSTQSPWQTRSLANLRRLVPTLQLEFV